MPDRVLFLLVMGWLIPGVGAFSGDNVRPFPPAAPESAEPDDVCEFLFLAPERPILLKVHLRADGRSFRAGWNAFCHRMFREFDQNGDGLLVANEWAGIPGLELLIAGNPRGAAQGTRSIREEIDIAPADGIITPDEFARALAERGARILTFQTLRPGEQSGRGGTIAGRNSGTGFVLFARLDGDGDGRLSPAEFAAGPRVLARVDFDDDGAFSRLELQPGRLGNAFLPPAAPPQSARPAELIDLTQGAPTESIARRLLDRYDHGVPSADGSVPESAGDETLDRREAPFPASVFDRLDTNHDETLDFEELQEVGVHLRDGIEILVRIDQRAAGQPAAEILDQAPELKAVVRETREGQITILVAGTQIELGCQAATAGSRIRDLFQQQFKMADADNNSYLDRQEARQSAYFNQTCDAMDEDGDGKLFENEMFAYIGRLEAAADFRYTLGVADEGRNLFEALDSNRDGRLGARELLAAPSRLAEWDGDRDGKLSEPEIPAHYRLVFGRALPDIPGLSNLLPARAPGVPAAGPVGETGPAWFRKMDRNRDGDLSRREFLGSHSVFESLDTNHDSLIDATEADAHP
jgi:Ca2+-binding EF-hand superfamily protein